MKKIFKKSFISIIMSLVICMTYCDLSFCYAKNNSDPITWKDKISKELYEEMIDNKGSDETVNVCIWYKDVEQEQIEKMVEKKTGLKRADISANNYFDDTELFKELSKLDADASVNSELKNNMAELLEKTKQVREKEKKDVEKYMSEWRHVAKDVIEEISEEVIDELDLEKSDISFQSKYAPMVMTEMTYEEIKRVAKNADVEEIALVPEDSEATDLGKEIEIAELKTVNGYDVMYENTKLSGKGVAVGMIEGSVPHFNHKDYQLDKNKIMFLNGTATVSNHATYVAHIINGKTGMAPDATVYAISQNELTQKYSNHQEAFCRGVEALMDAGVAVINCSYGFYLMTEDYELLEKWIDYLISSYGVTVVTAAGNEGKTNDRVRAPGLAYNVITVGGVHDQSTAVTTDDCIYEHNYNDLDGCEKPDILAPMNVGDGGTSSATPVATGVVALMLELKPSLALYPQAIKAILMASCHRKALDMNGITKSETMEKGLTDRQGAGVINPYIALSIVGQGQYGVGEFSNNTEYIGFVQPKYSSSKMNVSVTWMQKNWRRTGIPYSDTAIKIGEIQNVDMTVYRGSSVVGTSKLGNSSTEMAYISLVDGADAFRIKLSKKQDNDETVSYGYAWSTNDNQKVYQTPRLEGIYYLRNKNSGLYLRPSTTSGDIYPKQYSYTSGLNQMWIIRENSDGTCQINTANNTNKGMLMRYSSSSNSTVVRTSGSSNIKLYENGDGTYRIMLKRDSSSTRDALFINSSSVSTGARASWTSFANLDSQKWYLEKVNYQTGDVNMDGDINYIDEDLVKNAALGITTLKTCETFLADMDSNNTINLTDLTLLQKKRSLGLF